MEGCYGNTPGSVTTIYLLPRLEPIADNWVNISEIYKDITILVTLSALPQSREDCPKLGTYPRKVSVRRSLAALQMISRGY